MKNLTKLFFVSTLCFCLPAFAGTNENSFDPDSIIVPIREISMSGPSGSSVLYNCEGDPEDCLVDVVDSAALDLLTSSSEITLGMYDTITIGNCKSEGVYSARVRGSVELGGVMYYTTSDGQVLSTDIDDLDYVEVEFNGCSTETTIPNGFEVTLDGDNEINLFFALPDIAWANLSLKTIPSGCAEGTIGSVCLAYPDVLPSVGVTSPTMEHYYLSEMGTPETAGGQILLILDSMDQNLRRIYASTLL